MGEPISKAVPPLGCVRVFDDGVIEAGFRSFRMWDARGEQSISDSSRSYMLQRHTLAIGHKGHLYAVAPRTGNEGSIHILRSSDGGRVRTIKRASRFTMVWAPTDEVLANIATKGKVFLSPPKGDECYLGTHADAGYASFSFDGTMLATFGKQVDKLWNVSTSKQIDERPSKKSLEYWCSSHANALGYERTLQDGLFTVRSAEGNVIASVPCNENPISSRDGKYWASRQCHYVLHQ